jgi:hypothetical protein
MMPASVEPKLGDCLACDERCEAFPCANANPDKPKRAKERPEPL